MKLVYVAGPFRAPSQYEIALNVRTAEAYSLHVCQLGHMPIVPHKNTEFFHGLLPDDFFLEGYLEVLSACDAVLVVGDWLTSEGTRAEIAEARKLDIPVFFTVKALADGLCE